MTAQHADMTNPQHILIDELPSTNNKMKELIDLEDLPEFSIVQTHHQFAGRGQMGNQWESESNKNLTFSVLLLPDFLPIQDQFEISKVVSLAILNSLKRIIDGPLSIKWPNDIYYKTHKIAGILIENSIMGHHIQNSVIGIGLNVNQVDFTPNAPNAISVKTIINSDQNLETLLQSIISNIKKYYQLLQHKNQQAINRSYLDNLFLINKISYFKDKQETFKGTIIGIDPYGKLIIYTENEQKRLYEFKDVSFIIDSEARY